MSGQDQASAFSYQQAFCRNLGFVTEEEQDRLRSATVAIAGLGGVGGGHALTLARQGVGGFALADPDHFSVSNFNRQVGARMSTVDRNKAEVIRDMILDINPTARVTMSREGISPENIDVFLRGSDLVLDGLDIFAIPARRMLYAHARARGLWTLSAGPMGYGGTLLAFSPTGMTFDRYFDLRDGMELSEALASFLAGVAPARFHLRYVDRAQAVEQFRARSGPSSIIGCELASVLICTEALAVLLGRRAPDAAPKFTQFDPYIRQFRRGTLRLGNRGPLQLLARRALTRLVSGVLRQGPQAEPL